MKKIMFSLALSLVLFSCDNDEKIEVKDYGMKTFEADLQYSSTVDPESGYPISTYAQQTYFKFGQEEAVAYGTINTDSWTQFNVFDKTAEDYNATSEVEGWDLVFTNYYGTTYDSENMVTGYQMTGVLHNIENGIQVAEMDYKESTETDAIAQAFANLAVSDVSALEFSADIETIGSDWKSFDLSTYQYSVSSNRFYIVKLEDGNFFKLRLISFYGETTSERIIKMEYALMQ